MARGTRDDPLSAAESAAWWAANRERWMAWAFADKPPKDGEWVRDPWHGWVRRSNARARANQRKMKS